MSVILETSLGDITIDLFYEDCPKTCKNFLKLCKIKYYNNCIFHNIQKNYLIQTGDPTGTGRGGTSIYGILYGEQATFFNDEIRPHFRHKRIGTVSMANIGPNLNASQFFITTGENLTSLDDKHTIFGEVAEGIDVVMKINDAFVDTEGRPLQVIRIRHTVILYDPFEDPPDLPIPDRSPSPIRDLPPNVNMLPEDVNVEEEAKDAAKQEELKKKIEEREAKTRQEILVLVDDIPDADIEPPPNVLFVCKLNPVTTAEDLEIIFSRFGKIKSCEVIRDWKTGESLRYAFIEFETPEQCEEAYFKMNDVLIDDCRIHVDFSQSVAKVNWRKAGGWRRYFADQAKEWNKSVRSRDQRDTSRSKHRSERTSNLDLKSGARKEERDRDKYSLIFDDEKSESEVKDTDKNSNKDQYKEKRETHREKERDKDTERRKEKDKIDEKHKHIDKDRNRDGDREKHRDKENKDRDRNRDGDREKHRDIENKDRDRGRDGDREKHRDKDSDRDKEKETVWERRRDDDKQKDGDRSKRKSPVSEEPATKKHKQL
jgi:peptidyl-prolyl cis-trans isomerase-like 4